MYLLLFSLQRFRNADDYAVLYSDVSLYYLTGKNIDYPAVLEDHIGLDLTQRGRCQLFELFVFQGSLLSAHAVKGALRAFQMLFDELCNYYRSSLK